MNILKAARENKDRMETAENAAEVLRCIFKSHDVVYGIVGEETFIIKGASKIDSPSPKITGIFCRSEEEVATLAKAFGGEIYA